MKQGNDNENRIKFAVKMGCKNNTDKIEITELIFSLYSNRNDIHSLITFLIKSAYDENSPIAERKVYKEIVINLISGTYYDALCSKSSKLINKYKSFLKKEGVCRKDVTYYKRTKNELDARETANDFILKKLYEKDALSDFLRFDYKHILQFLNPVLENHFKTTHNIRNIRMPESNEDSKVKKEIITSSIPDNHPAINDRVADIEDKEQSQIYRQKLAELSEEFPLEANLLKKLLDNDDIHKKDDKEIFSERNNKDKSSFYVKKGAYLKIVREKGEFNYINILENHGRDLKKIVLENGSIAFEDYRKNNKRLAEDEMEKRAIDFLKQSFGRFLRSIRN